jgi:hypothetical protein
MVNAAPHFRMDSNPAVEVAHNAISIQLFRSAVSPLRRESVTITMLSIIQATIAYIIGGLWISVCTICFRQSVLFYKFRFMICGQ